MTWQTDLPSDSRRVLIRTDGYWYGAKAWKRKGQTVYEDILTERPVKVAIGRYEASLKKWINECGFVGTPRVTGWMELPEC